MRMRILSILWLLLTFGLAGNAFAELAIVSAPDGIVTDLSRSQAERLYLGRTSTLPDNTPVKLIDLPPGPERDRFYLLLTGKNPVQTRAYWSRQVFTGRALPPRQASSVDEMREWVRSEPNAIGYLPTEAVDARVRILLLVEERE